MCARARYEGLRSCNNGYASVRIRAQTIKQARQALDKYGRHFTLIHLNLERCVIAYYLYIGRINDVESKICKLYMHIQQVYDPQHELAVVFMNDIALCLNMQGNFHDAHDMLLETLNLFKKAGSSASGLHTCAAAHNNLAVSLMALGRAREAELHVREALQMLKDSANPFVSAKPTLYLRACILMHLGVRVDCGHECIGTEL